MPGSDSTPPRPAPRRRRWFRRGVIVALLAANLVAGFTYWRLRSIESILDRTVVTHGEEVSDALSPRPDTASDAIVFLVLGSDSRRGLDDLANFGAVDGERADVIMVVQVHPQQASAQILSLPRDLWVDIPGEKPNRINAAYALGGPSLTVETVRQVVGLPIHHVIEVDFVGFEAIVEEVGGVEMSFPHPARDLKSGLRVDAGTQLLSGKEALAFVRSRQYQELRNGSWVSVDANDLGRTRRQQQLVFAILHRLKRPSTLTEAGSIVEAVAKNLTVDSAFTDSSLIELAFRMRGIGPDRIEAVTLPVTGATIDGKSVLLADEPAASTLLSALQSGRPIVAAAERSDLQVRVLNGNGVQGSAGYWSDILESQGFTISGVGDADRKDYSVTTVMVRPDHHADGRLLVEALGFGVVEVGTVESGIDAVVVMGGDAPMTTAMGAG